ncbi:hypothetical protein CH267_06415 [Rhodococcus sp. 06-621-2]|nr:NADP-dependent oxidoreductase [Rhodococcus sp. 06-621-2]OZC59731.1 hypothetical protein CH267_06415 [Rhodococcus sp. 06-621-2]
MRVVGFNETGGPEVLSMFEVPEPHPGPGQVRVTVAGAAVSPVDAAMRSGFRADQYVDVPAPHVPGFDFAGTVDEVGADTPFTVGQAVLGVTFPVVGGGGAYAEKVVTDAANVVAVPDSIDILAAATIPMNALTAIAALDALNLPAGAWLGVTGAAGAVGGYAIQLAADRGLHVVADASKPDEDLIASLGAEKVVRRGENVAEHMRQVVPGGVDGLIDAAAQGAAVIPAITDSGGYVTVRYADLKPERDITLHAVAVSDIIADHPRCRRALDTLARLLATGALTPRIASTIPAEHAADAHRALAAGGLRGRQVLTF